MITIIKNQETAQTYYTKIFMDLLASCYDKIDKAEADTYAMYNNPDDISCANEHVAGLLNFIPSNYKEITSEEQMRPTPHQIVLAQAYQVTIKCEDVANEGREGHGCEETQEGREGQDLHLRLERYRSQFRG